jgi:G3E family GTPase
MAEGLGPAIGNALRTRPDAILIEASGVGEPRRIAEFALLDRALRLDMIVTLANSVVLNEQLDDPLIGDTVARQFDGADLIVLNHVDDATAGQLAGAHDSLRRFAPGRRVVETIKADLPLDLLTATPHAIFAAGPLDQRTDHGHDFTRSQFETSEPIARRTLEALLANMPASVLRLKGWVRVEGEETPVLVQYVAGRWSILPAPSAPPVTRLVAITARHPFDIQRALKSELIPES